MQRGAVDSSLLRSGKMLSGEGLLDRDVLVVSTWPVRQHRFRSEECRTIHQFVLGGGGLVLMSNHRPFHANDGQLAAVFGVEIQPTFFENQLSNADRRSLVPTVLAERELNAEHPIVAGASAETSVDTVVTSTCSSIQCARGEPLIYLSQEMAERKTKQLAQPDQLFAHALDLNTQGVSSGRGRIVTIADSGFIGSRWTELPGPGPIT